MDKGIIATGSKAVKSQDELFGNFFDGPGEQCYVWRRTLFCRRGVLATLSGTLLATLGRYALYLPQDPPPELSTYRRNRLLERQRGHGPVRNLDERSWQEAQDKLQDYLARGGRPQPCLVLSDELRRYRSLKEIRAELMMRYSRLQPTTKCRITRALNKAGL